MQQLSTNLPFPLMLTRWASTINQVLSDPLTNHVILTNVVLTAGTNVINTTLGRQMQGWFITDLTAPVTVYRSAPLNNLTLTLTSSGAATITLVIF